MDAVIDYLPSPLDLSDVEGFSVENSEKKIFRKRVVTEPFSALAFKIVSDPYVDQLAYMRVYSGEIEVGSTVLNARLGKRERISKILIMHSNQREEVKKVGAGEICAVAGLKLVGTGDTLCDQKHPISFESLSFPEPVISIAIEPKSSADSEKLVKALQRLEREDPSFKMSFNPETGQTLISGMGELHLEIIADRLLREFRVAANVGAPQVSYRETITQKSRVEKEFVRETEKLHQYARVVLEVEPLKSESKFVFENKADLFSVPPQFINGVKIGIEEGLQSGAIAGFSVIDVKVTLLGGKFDQANSDEASFKIAASMAVSEAIRNAKPIILQPMMSVEVLVPDEYVSGVITDINSRRAHVSGISQRGSLQCVNAIAPLSGMFGYSTSLRSSTQGRATYTMQFHSYEEVPRNVLEQITGGATW
jgi:elongation factor G